MRKRNCSLHLRLTEKELTDLKKTADRAGVNIQTYVLALICGKPLKEKPPIEYQAVMKSLGEANRKLDRIVKHATGTSWFT